MASLRRLLKGQRRAAEYMEIRFEEGSELESESIVSGSSKVANEVDIDYGSDGEESWREESNKFLCIISLVYFTSKYPRSIILSNFNYDIPI